MLLNYLKIAWKVLLRHPFYTFITLFGITLTLTVLMVLTSFLDHLFGAHYPEGNRNRSLYITMMMQTDSARESVNTGPYSFQFLKRHAKTLKSAERVSIASMFGFSNSYVGGKRIKLNTKFTDADFWHVTNYKFLEGKPYNDQTIAQGERVVVITDDLKKQYFEESTESVIGKTIEIESITYKVMGVVRGGPPTRVYTYADVFFPYTAPKSNYQNAGMRGGYQAIVLAKTPGDRPEIQAEYDNAIRQIPLPAKENGFTFSVIVAKADTYFDGFLRTFLRSDNEPNRLAFYGIASLVLLMFMGLPAINLVNVNVSRMLERASEIGVRKAFGAPSQTLLGQFIIENIFITFIGGVFALGLSYLIIYYINSSGLIAYADLTINWVVFVTSLGVCLLFGLLSGVLPALKMSRLKIVDALKA
ncbi:ABC transporter permease [Arundinibacter roseus]|uniref:FtsX-like permease family protein n=1 Tax=Arundinibacter roseus TaxID=2070510 RepID=A0A4R4KGY4_9BACT|nr:ABC transporter permease [Arundinibacter roseus]TDB67304.1 FtsX-like permease family protein [Arundinibacter roseus]